MRRFLALLLCALLAGLSSCGLQPSGSPLTDLTAVEIRDRILASQPADFSEPLILMTAEEEAFTAYAAAAYGMEEGTWSGGAAGYSSGVGAAEVAVFQMADGDEAERAAGALAGYVESRAGDFFGYAPAEYELLEGALVLRRGEHVALVVCPNPEEAAAAFDGCFHGGTEVSPTARPTARPMQEGGYTAFDPPNEYDMTPYDGSAVAEAFLTGDRSALSAEEAELLELCEGVLAECVTADMSGYEKELAIHDWMVQWADYDHSHAAESLSPLAFLRDRKAICLGYANTFQILMDLLDIECITVVGAAYHSSEDHAWNMVRLDGDWYCVDVTWDDSGGHRYFNVTSDFMRATDHQWDYDGVPEAVSDAYAYRGQR